MLLQTVCLQTFIFNVNFISLKCSINDTKEKATNDCGNVRVIATVIATNDCGNVKLEQGIAFYKIFECQSSPPLSAVPLFVVSIICSQPEPEIIKREVPEINDAANNYMF